jgi:hypothetical protein
MKKFLREKIILTPIEQRYISTCYPLPDRPCLDKVEYWKRILRESAKNDKNLEISFNDFGLAFPHIGILYLQGFFDERSIQSYFEGIDEKSHNMRMYLFAKKMDRKRSPQILNVLLHIEYCSVKPADLENQKIHSYGMNYDYPIDTGYFSDMQLKNNFVLVHGKSKKGLIAIREITKEEFEIFSNWFEERQKSKENPFVKFKDELEKYMEDDLRKLYA